MPLKDLRSLIKWKPLQTRQYSTGQSNLNISREAHKNKLPPPIHSVRILEEECLNLQVNPKILVNLLTNIPAKITLIL
jgi:hypothetical protein